MVFCLCGDNLFLFIIFFTKSKIIHQTGSWTYAVELLWHYTISFRLRDAKKKCCGAFEIIQATIDREEDIQLD